MAKWRSYAHFGPEDGFTSAHEKKARRRRNRLADRSLRIEPCEERKLFAVSPTLIAVIPNEGSIINNGDTVTVAPRELTIRFDDGQLIDAATLGSITVTRSNFDDVFNANDVAVNVGYVGIGEKANEVVIRFAENLPDDRYRVRIDAGLKNTEGDAFNNGNPTNVDFNLNLGAQVIAVVPQPVTRTGSTLTQATNQIDVYFNNDDLSPVAAQNKLFYELIRTNDTVTTLDDTLVNPLSVVYDNSTDKATLTFAAGVLETAGTFRLRIGNNDPLPLAPVDLTAKVTTDENSTYNKSTDLGTIFTAPAGNQSVQLTAAIDPQPFELDFPGSQLEPGHRESLEESHLNAAAAPDALDGVKVQFYNFPAKIGAFPNVITEDQKQRFREIFSLYSAYSGIQFVETEDMGYSLAVGDIRYIDPTAATGPRGVGTAALTDVSKDYDPFSVETTVMNFAYDWGTSPYGGDFFLQAIKQVGKFLGLDSTNDLPSLTVTGNNANGGVADGPIGTAEKVYPGDADIVHMQHLFRPDVKDIDTYKFTLSQAGTLTLETLAQRRTDNTDSFLDSVISVYDSRGNLVARNDDYFGRDSYLKLSLPSDTYYVAITASGNTAFDLNVEDSGIGGVSNGKYDLRMNFEPTPSGGLVDATGVLLDGDADGRAGGDYNFWFKSQQSDALPAMNHVIWVDKLSTAAPGTADGTLARPFTNIALALATAAPGDIVRIVGNNINADGTVDLTNAITYNLGQSIFDTDLTDGGSMEVPKGVTVMIDAGAIFRLRGTSIDVGTSDVGIDRSAGAVQILGTPTTSVIFTSWHDQATGKDIDPLVTTPLRGDWGGLVFREDSDLEQNGIFLNYVNHADIRYGGGQNASLDVFNPIHMIEARPTVSFNKITLSADAAMSADPNSFEETVFGNAIFTSDYGRVGPDIHGNTAINNTFNALFVRIETLPNNKLEPLTVQARFDDTDIVHIITENILIQGDAGGALLDANTGNLIPRLAAQLAIDPGIVVKLGGARIETQPGAQFLAEGTAANPVIFTSTLDDRYGRGGTFDTTGDLSASSPNRGDWSGFYFGPTSSASLDHVLITYAGGFSGVGGGSAEFNAVEIQQADVRIANSILENNADGDDAEADGDIDTARDGHLTNEAATIFVRGAQPTLVNNIIRHGAGAAISINVNSLNSELNNDPGRSTGLIDRAGDFFTNVGPLVKNNLLDDMDINGMVVRGGTLTTQSVWDDTDIVHVVQEEIAVGNLHTYGGLRLQSRPGESLVVKLLGAAAGFTASGLPLDIDDRIGGSVQVVGVAGAPVILTSLNDDTVGTGRKPDGSFLKDTNNDGSATAPAAGDWRSVKLDRYSNDRNVATVNETEQGYPATGDANATRTTAQQLGLLAPNEKSGDDNVRLGFEIHGAVSQTYSDRTTADPADDRLADVDVYRFDAKAGTEVWLDIDRTTQAMDVVVELIDANGSVVARSDNSTAEQASADLVTFNSPDLVGSFDRVKIMQRDIFGGQDFYTTNPRDAGMRVVLPGNAGETKPYYVRVRANSANLSNTFQGASYGTYQLQVRLREKDEAAGSTVMYSDIRFATNAIEIIGKPENSPLLGESADAGNNNTLATAQEIGNLLASNRNTLAVSGLISSSAQVDWYEFSIDFREFPASYGALGASSFWPTVFDLDYADGLGRVNASLAVFDASGTLIYWSSNGGVDDDQPRPETVSGDVADLSRGSMGNQDPYIGSVDLAQGGSATYYVAVSSSAAMPAQLNPAVNPLVRLEPVAEYNRLFSDRDFAGGGEVGLTADEFHLGDVILYVNTGTDLFTVNPFTGGQETDVTGPAPAQLPLSANGVTIGDIAMRNDGRLYTLTIGNGNTNFDQLAQSGNYIQLSTENGANLSSVDDKIVTYQFDPQAPDTLVSYNAGVQFEALAHLDNAARNVYAVGNITPAGNGVQYSRNILYRLRDDGVADIDPNDKAPTDARQPTDVRERGILFTSPTLIPTAATDTAGSNADQGYTNPDDVLDGLTFTITDLDGDTLTFEMDAGVDIAVSSFGAADIRDGNTFKMGDGITSKTFEFNSGPVLVVKDGANLVDGDSFAITDNTGAVVTFVFDNDGKINTGEVPITFVNTDSLLTVMGNTVTAINGAKFNVDASNSPFANFAGRVSLVNDKAVALGGGVTSATLEGDYTVGAGNVAIAYEETDAFSVLGASIAGAVTGVLTPIRAGFAERTGSTVAPPAERGDRLSFFGGVATAADLAGTPAFSLTNDIDGNPSKTGVGVGNIQIPFDASDSSVELSELITNAINNAAVVFPNFDVTATRFAATIQLTGVQNNLAADPPFSAVGEGPGGLITGMAFLGNTLYAVSDLGGFYTVDNYDAYENAGPGSGPRLNYIDTSEADLLGISFTGLTAGPESVEGGLYANTLFATAADGTIYAFNTAGELLPIFHDGATSISTGIAGLQGLTFSTLDYNLWGQTGLQGGAAGHTGDPNSPSAFYFGLQDPAATTTFVNQPNATDYSVVPGAPLFGPNGNPALFNTYNLPGGAHGSLTTDYIDLTDYTSNDAPTLYFTYFYDAGTDDRYDAMRVFISSDDPQLGDDTGDWFLVADDRFVDNLTRNSGGWRQARIDLGVLAGLDNIRIRFDFSTAGDMEVGTNEFGGEILRALPGDQLLDGDTFSVDGQTFEFDLGPSVSVLSGSLATDGDTVTMNGDTFEFDVTTLTLPSGLAAADGDTFTINGTTFEIDKNGVNGGLNVVSLLATDTPSQVAAKVTLAINNAAIAGVTAVASNEKVALEGVTTISEVGTTVTVVGTPGVTGGNTPVAILFTDSAAEVANKLADAITAAAIGVNPIVTASSINLVGATGLAETGSLVTITGADGVDVGNIAIVVDASMTGADVAQAIATQLDDYFVATVAGNVDDPAVFQSVKVDGSLIHVITHNVDDPGVLPWSDTLLAPAPFNSSDHPDVPVPFPDRFFEPDRGRDNNHQGIYIDDLILGFAGRGEQVLFANSSDAYVGVGSGTDIVVGNYDLEIRQGRTPELAAPTPYPIGSSTPDPVGRVEEDGEVPIQTDIRDRLARAITLLVQDGASVAEAETFRISDGNNTIVFEFDSNGVVGSDTLPNGTIVVRTAVPFDLTTSAIEMAEAVVTAINDLYVLANKSSTDNIAFNVRANFGGAGRVELFDAASIGTSQSVSFQIALDGGPPLEFVDGDDLADLQGSPFTRGDQNTFRDQGYTLIGFNTISDSAEYGILVDSPVRDEPNQPHPGSVRNLHSINTDRLVPGISLFNNLLVAGGDGGIHFSGDATTGTLAAAPFGRIVNNTIYGGSTANGVGILVDDGASPTITNNVLANNVTGIQIATGTGTELNLNLYQGNTTPVTGGTEPSLAGVTNFLSPADALFVDAANRNFYLKSGSKAIDSSDNSIDERSKMHTVITNLGIPDSPILAPSLDLLGQLRVDDSTVSSPPGLGSQVFKDRGAIERADFTGGTVALVNPIDNDAAGLDKNSTSTQVQLLGQKLSNFSFQFTDGTGVGIADVTVTQANITFRRNGTVVPTTDYLFSYDTTSNTVRLQAAAGIFSDGIYTIEINNTATGVRDIADNPIKPNQASGVDAGKTMFTIEIAASALAPWQNPANALDVNASGLVTPLDAAILIDRLNRFGIGALPLPASPPPYYDVNGDGNITPADLVQVITFLNQQAAGLLASFESSDTAPLSLLQASPTETTTVSTIDTTSGDVAFGLSTSSVTKSTSGSSTVSYVSGSVVSSERSVSLDDVWASVGEDRGDLLLGDVLDDLAGDSSSDESNDDILFEEIDALLV